MTDKTTMEYLTLAAGGPRVSKIGLGCMSMSDFYDSNRDRAESIATIRRALDLGVNFIDTADMYGMGHNEELVGEAIRERRDEAFVCTKFGNVRAQDGSFLGVNGKPEYVKQACEASLKRLGVDAIDLYYQHRVDPNTPIEETVGAMAELVAAGKVKYLGLSEASASTLRRAHGVHPIAALQSEYSLWSRDVEAEILPTCRELGVTFVAYSPLGRGFLTGKIKKPEDLDEGDWRRHHPRFTGENFAKNLRIVEIVERIAQRHGCTPAQLAIAWTIGQGVLPIPGSKSRRHLEENVAAVGIQLTEAERRELDESIPPGAAAGDRYSEAGMKAVNL